MKIFEEKFQKYLISKRCWILNWLLQYHDLEYPCFLITFKISVYAQNIACDCRFMQINGCYITLCFEMNFNINLCFESTFIMKKKIRKSILLFYKYNIYLEFKWYLKLFIILSYAKNWLWKSVLLKRLHCTMFCTFSIECIVFFSKTEIFACSFILCHFVIPLTKSIL